MSDFDQLSADSQYLLAEFMDKFYLNIKKGQSRLESKNVAMTLDDVQKLLPQAKRDDLKDYIYELSHAGFLNHGNGRNEPIEIVLTNKAIVWSQNKFGNNIKKLTKWASRLIKLIKP